MRTAQERESAFRQDLAELLAKHGAELQVTDDGKDYGMHNGICIVTMPAEWVMAADCDAEPVAEYTEFRL
jgi:hypothetical protein